MRVHMSEKASWELAAGDEIAQGRSVLKLLGGGRRYEAYLVWDEHMSTRLVAKLVRPDRAEDGSALRALRREAEALDVLAHPAIPRCFDAVPEPPHPHLLLEHLEGASLRRLVRRHGPLPAERLLAPAVGVASALRYMHGERWVHLDLKADHVLTGRPPRLIDLSLARTVERAARLAEPVGTNAYMSPEQCAPSGDVGPAADVWALGATLYYALSGRRPFPAPLSTAPGTAVETRYPQLEEEVHPLPAEVPSELAAAIMACLRRTPVERPTATELALRLQALSAPVVGRRSPPRSAERP
jgi:eukaryotic-like serine/threonine-protein kinase